ncbi:MAG: hypothetical protein ACWA44_06970 [Thiotrichales bacterium]
MRWFAILLVVVSGITNNACAEPRTLDIDWTAANKDAAALRSLGSPPPNLSGGEVDASSFSATRLPVLLPSKLAFISYQASADKNSYDVQFQIQDATLLVSGDRYFQYLQSEIDADGLSSSTRPQFLNSFGISQLLFTRYGANYSLSLECSDPQNDSRCIAPEYLNQLYDSLHVVGGQP